MALTFISHALAAIHGTGGYLSFYLVPLLGVFGTSLATDCVLGVGSALSRRLY